MDVSIQLSLAQYFELSPINSRLNHFHFFGHFDMNPFNKKITQIRNQYYIYSQGCQGNIHRLIWKSQSFRSNKNPYIVQYGNLNISETTKTHTSFNMEISIFQEQQKPIHRLIWKSKSIRSNKNPYIVQYGNLNLSETTRTHTSFSMEI